MRSFRRDQQKMMYSFQIGTVPRYVRDDNGNIVYETYSDSDGNEIFILDDDGNRIPQDTGEKEIIYSSPKEFFASISESGGKADAQAYGLSTESYEAVALYGSGLYPITIGCLIWKDSAPECRHAQAVPFDVEVRSGGKETVYSTWPEEESADFRVLKCIDSPLVTKLILKAVEK